MKIQSFDITKHILALWVRRKCGSVIMIMIIIIIIILLQKNEERLMWVLI
jgi:hypothetical protein